MKLFSRILVAALSLILLTGACALAEGATLIVGTNPEFPPFESVGDDGEVVGIDIDIINAIAEKIGMTVVIESMDFDALNPSLSSGKIDVAIAGMTNTEERRKSVLFSEPYFQASQKIIVREGSPIAAEADLADKRIGVQLGTTGDLYVSEMMPGATIDRYNKGIDAVQDLVSGRLDAVVIDEAPAGVFVAQAPGLIILPDRLSDEVYSIALPMGQDELLAKINGALAELKEEGALAAIVAAYDSEE
jgi:ABC-type amino acid transport substrate-binding protein